MLKLYKKQANTYLTAFDDGCSIEVKDGKISLDGNKSVMICNISSADDVVFFDSDKKNENGKASKIDPLPYPIQVAFFLDGKFDYHHALINLFSDPLSHLKDGFTGSFNLKIPSSVSRLKAKDFSKSADWNGLFCELYPSECNLTIPTVQASTGYSKSSVSLKDLAIQRREILLEIIGKNDPSLITDHNKAFLAYIAYCETNGFKDEKITPSQFFKLLVGDK